MNFDAIKASRYSVGRSSLVVVDNTSNLVRLQSSRSLIRLLSNRGVDVVATQLHSRRRNGQGTIMKAAMGSAPHVPELQENEAFLVMHSFRDGFPCLS